MKHLSTKHLLLAMFLAISWLPARSQLVLVRHVTSTSGGSGIAGGIHFDYTLGEAAISPLSAGPILLTQGFQQPEILPPLVPGGMPVLDFSLFPNPALTTFKIQFSLLTNANVSFLLLNTAGQVIYQDVRDYAPGKVVIPTSVDKLAAGIYTVVLKVNQFTFTEKLIVQ
ncbi:T9SS type A sorting domain-containing protein [uncultured Chitinophaga sp.]|uniref:T9SS type A sorting domain-containing protein n=1 Tax=uncultured Chitinophaga sp. TaxID=339340 RepID=UPI002638F815|nr:T9SS type A sorting domain-containing protein [uncultured Chitinophaga sp.]